MVEVISDRHTPLASCRQYSGREGFSLKLFLCVCAGVVGQLVQQLRHLVNTRFKCRVGQPEQGSQDLIRGMSANRVVKTWLSMT